MVGLYQDPEGKTVFLRTNHSCSTTNNLVSDRDTIESLRKQVQELKNEVRVTVHVGKAGLPRGLGGPRANTKSGTPRNGCVSGVWGQAPRKIRDFVCPEVCSGGSWGSFLCMHTVHIHLQVAVFD